MRSSGRRFFCAAVVSAVVIGAVLLPGSAAARRGSAELVASGSSVKSFAPARGEVGAAVTHAHTPASAKVSADAVTIAATSASSTSAVRDSIGADDFSQHTNYQTDLWLTTAASVIAREASGSAASANLPRLWDGHASGHFRIRPSSIVVSCADGGEYDLRWASWSANRAVGQGITRECRGAARTITVIASQVLQHEFTRLEVSFAGGYRRVLVLAGYHATPPLAWDQEDWVRNPNSGLEPWPFHSSSSASSHVSSSSSALIECQRPVTTGAEVGFLHRVTVKVACPLALSLHHWATTGHIVVRCTGPEFETPSLVLHNWRGWRLSIARHFLWLRRGTSSFATGGTDFPAPCI